MQCRKISASMKMATALMTPLPYCLDPIAFEAADSVTDGTESNLDQKWVPGTSAPFALASDEHVYTLMPVDDDIKSKPVTKLSDIPQCLHAFPPYLLAALPKRLEVRSLDPNDLIQVLNIPRIRHMCSNDLGWLYASAVACVYQPDDSKPCLSSDEGPSPTMDHGSDVWLLLPMNRLRCVQRLVNQKVIRSIFLPLFALLFVLYLQKFEMALRLASFANISGQPSIPTYHISALFAFDLFNTMRNFDVAFQYFYKLKTDPILVLGLCGNDFYKEELAPNYPSPAMPLAESEKSALFESLIRFLVRWRSHLRSNCPQGAGFAEFIEQQIPCGTIVDSCIRLRKRKYLLEAVDTSLLKCYNGTNIARIGPLLRQKNYCSLDVAEEILKSNKRFKDLVKMYKERGMHRTALALMVSESEVFSFREIVSYVKELRDAPFDLIAEFCENILKQQPRAWMSIFLAWERRIYHNASVERKDEYYSLVSYRNKVMRYLEHVAPHLLIPFLEHILFGACGCKIDEEEEGLDALDVLHDDTSNFLDESFSLSCPLNTTENHNLTSTPVVPRQSVTSSETPSMEPQRWEMTCVWPFPRHCHVHPISDSCRICLSVKANEDITDFYMMPEILLPPKGFLPCVELYDTYVLTLLKEIEKNSQEQTMAYHVAEEEPPEGIVAILRHRLLQFLSMENVQLSAEELLSKLPYDGCFEERAVLLARLERHRQALTMWVHLLGDWSKALEHCAKAQAEGERCFINATNAGSVPKDKEPFKLHEIYTILIDVCLNPLEPIALGIILPSMESSRAEINQQFKPRIDLALIVATQFSEFVDVTSALRMIPDDVNLKSIAPFLRSTFKQHAGMRTRLIFFNKALYRESLRSHNDRVTTTAAQMFNVTATTRCRQCRRRIGTAAFVRYPDSGDLVHYGCCRDLPVNSNSPNTLQHRL
ncbi:hypothetical protein Aperf_G00000043389 [Anoplocephala perfoliata]